jgi:hypothetical protein
MSRSLSHLRLSAVLVVAAVAGLAACSSPAAPSGPASADPVASPGEPLGVFPGVDGFSYRLETGTVPGFLRGVNQTLGTDVEVEIGLAAIATRGDDEVSLIAFGFPGADDTQSVDYFARVLDDMEDGFQAGSQPGLGGDAYLMTANGQTTVLAPFVRSPDGHLIFLFALGPQGPTEELVGAILAADG